MMLWMQMLIAVWTLHVVAGRTRPVACAMGLLVFIPIGGGHSLATAMRGLWGDPSIGAVQLMLFALAGSRHMAWRQDWPVPALVASMGILLYASALGPWDFDLYRLGYYPIWPVALFACAGLIMWWRGTPIYLWLLVIDLLVWHAGWMETTNFWDILIDPLLVVAMAALALRNIRRRRSIDTIGGA